MWKSVAKNESIELIGYGWRVMAMDRERLRCDRCNTEIGWINYSGPRGFVYCDACHEDDIREEDEDREDGE